MRYHTESPATLPEHEERCLQPECNRRYQCWRWRDAKAVLATHVRYVTPHHHSDNCTLFIEDHSRGEAP